MKQIPQQRATARGAPTVYLETIPAFCGGRTLADPLRDGNLRGREGHTPGWLLSAFGRFTFSLSPTKIKKDFQTWVEEALGPPAGDVQHRKSPPSSVSHALGTFSLEGRRLTGG